MIGYMASADHSANLEMVVAALVDFLDAHPGIRFELFGSIPVPHALARFGDRVTSVPPVDDYEAFLEALRGREWDIGICPLVPTEFNLSKANNKWVEYTAVGAAVIASAGTVYDDCSADGCGLLAESVDDWASALEQLVTDDEGRAAMVRRAQLKLETEYSVLDHREQILAMLEKAGERSRSISARQDA